MHSLPFIKFFKRVSLRCDACTLYSVQTHDVSHLKRKNIFDSFFFSRTRSKSKTYVSILCRFENGFSVHLSMVNAQWTLWLLISRKRRVKMQIMRLHLKWRICGYSHQIGQHFLEFVAITCYFFNSILIYFKRTLLSLMFFGSVQLKISWKRNGDWIDWKTPWRKKAKHQRDSKLKSQI